MIYLVPGLEMDARIISKVLFRGDTNYESIKWIEPLVNEKVESYAGRLSSQVKHQDVTFVGFSFGGIMAIELAKICSYKRVVLISAPQHKSQIPLWHRFLGKTSLVKIVSDETFTNSVFIRNFLMGMKTKERENLRTIHSELPKGLVRWGVQEALTWKNDVWLDRVHHIHSTNDKIYPHSRFKSNKNISMIEDGGHLMFAYKPKAVSLALKALLYE